MNNDQQIWIEQGVLLTVMSYEQFDMVSDILSADTFLANRHKNIYQAITDLATSGEPYDEVMVSDLMTKRGQIGEHACPLGYFAELSLKASATVSSLRKYGEMLVAKAKHRKAVDIVQKALGDLRDIENDSDVVTSRLITALSDIETAKQQQEVFEPDDLMESFVKTLETARSEKKPYVEVGFPELSNKLRLKNGQLAIIAARPSVGKSLLAMNIASHVADTQDGRTLFFTMEMPHQDLEVRMAAAATGTPIRAIMDNEMTEDNWAATQNYIANFNKKNITVIDKPAISLAQVRAYMNKLKRTHGKLSLVVIDYLGLMAGLDSHNSKNHDIGVITAALKQMALEFSCPIILLSQLNREVEKRPNKRPMMSDLRDSGNIEQDANIIMFLYREDVYKIQAGDTNLDGMAEVIIAKNRDGVTGTVRLGFEGHMGRFTNAIPNFGLDG